MDFGLVEVSADGGQTWTQVLKVTGIDTTWSSERIDLGNHLGETIGLRFRVTSNASTQFDGWYIDDVVIENGPRSVAFPWTDDVELGERSWFANSPWGLSNVGSHSGAWHWTDSPAGSYAPNENTSLMTTIDLSGAASPVMRFWQRYSFEPNADWGFVEVSANNGASWTMEYFLTGSQAAWRQEQIDLSPYGGNPQVMIRFRLQSNGSSESDGWHLDDFEVVDHTRQFPYPFKDTFDDSTSASNWLTSSWEFVTGGRSLPFQMHDSPLGNYPANAFSSLTMDGTVDLSKATSPVLTFWHKYNLYTNHSYWNEDDWGKVYVSPDNGQVWYQKAAYAGSQTGWSKASIDLSEFVGASAVRVRFTLDDNPNLQNTAQNNLSDGWWIDDIRLGENLAVQVLADLVRLEGPAEISAVPGLASPRLIGRVYEPSVTTTAGQGAQVVGQFGVGELGTMPNDSTWTWFAGGYLDDVSGADRFFGSVRADSVGTYAVAFRASINGGAAWVYGDLDGNDLAGGGVNEFERDKAGRLTVGRGGTVLLRSTKIERTLRVNDQEIWGIFLGNGGPDPLSWELAEARADSVRADVSWIVLQKTTGSIPQGKEVEVELTFDAGGLAADSTYRALLLLTSNDAQRDSLWLPVSLRVLPEGAPGLSGWVVLRGGANASGGSIVVYDAADAAVDTLPVAPNGWFSAYGITSGTYRLFVQAPGAYPQDFVRVEIPIEGTTLEVSPLHPHVVSPFFMEIFSDASTLDGLPIPVGTFVSVRDPDGVLCGGTLVSTAGSYGLLHVYADDPNTGDVDEGAEINDTLNIFVNDVPTSYKVVYRNHNTVTRVDVAVYTTTPRHLAAGLHLISLAVVPRDTALAGILSTIAGKYSYVAGFDQEWGGARTYVDSLKDFSDLHTLDGYHGYWLRMDQPGDLFVAGGRLHDDVSLELDAGWNLISYLAAVSLPPERALADIHDRLRVVGGFDAGAQTYVPGSAFSDLVEMHYGYGYWMYLTAPGVLNYRYNVSQPLAKPGEAIVADGTPIPTPEWMDLYGSARMDGQPIPAGTRIRITDGDGVVCGQTFLRDDGRYGFLHVYADDPGTDIDEGAAPGEVLHLLVDDAQVYGVPTILWQGSRTVVRMDLTLSSKPTTLADIRPLRFALDLPHPNPFNPNTVLTYELTMDGPVSLVVYDPLGRRVRTLVNAREAAGRRAVIWDGTDDLGRNAASGAYFVRLIAREGTLIQRLVLLR